MSGPSCTVLLLEDEAEFVAGIKLLATHNNWKLLHAANARRADELLSEEAVDVFLADRLLGAGEPDGLDLIERMRARGLDIPVIVLSSLGSTRERVRGLETGADAYLPKPYSGEELVAQINAVLRRKAGAGSKASSYGAMAVFPELQSVTWDGRRVSLTPKTFALLNLLAENLGQPVSNELIWQTVWPRQAKLGPQRAVIERMVKNLRSILKEATGGAAAVGNERGRGYFLELA